MQNINTAVLEQYNAATHSVIKGFVLNDILRKDSKTGKYISTPLTETQRLARIAVIHAIMDSPEESLGAYTKALLDILTEGNANYKDAHAAVVAVRQLEVSGINIVGSDYRLNDFGMTLIHSIAEAVAQITPERFLPMVGTTKAPNYADFRTLNVEQTATVKSYLVKGTKSKNSAYLNRKNNPKFFSAMDKLWSQQYSLNDDMMHIMNLPAEFAARISGICAVAQFANKFSFRYTADSRGRTYARCILAQPQGDSFSKAMLNLGTKKALGDKGLNALAIHYANVSGHDKLPLQERVAWARGPGMDKATFMADTVDYNHIVVLSEMGADDTKDVFEEYVAAREYYRASTSDDPTKYMSSLVVHQDATNSGFQFGAALLGDYEAALATNLLPSHYSQAPQDLYKQVAETMLTFLPGTHLTIWTPFVSRNTVKKAVMVTGYGAGIETAMEAFQEKLPSNAPETDDIVANALEEALEANAGALLTITAAMKVHAKQIGGTINWKTADGFIVRHDYQEEIYFGSGKYKVIKSRNGGIDAVKNASALPPNFIHSMDGCMLRTAATKSHSIAFVPIHDSFGTHAADFFTLGRILREAFIKTLSYDWYGQFCTDNQVKPRISNSNGFDITDVRKSTYMFS